MAKNITRRAEAAFSPIAPQSEFPSENVETSEPTDDLASFFRDLGSAGVVVRVAFYTLFLVGIAIVFFAR
jgi:hypothetical protein